MTDKLHTAIVTMQQFCGRCDKQKADHPERQAYEAALKVIQAKLEETDDMAALRRLPGELDQLREIKAGMTKCIEDLTKGNDDPQ